MRADVAQGVRLAVEDLTARASDSEGDTVGLADEGWDAFVRNLLGRGSEEDGAELVRRLLGYREVSFVLVQELADARMITMGQVMEKIGWWVTTPDELD